MRVLRYRELFGRVALIAAVSTMVGMGPVSVRSAYSQGDPQAICGGQAIAPPVILNPPPNAEGWVSDQESLADGGDVKRYRFTVKETGTAYVYVGDQWYDLNLGLFSVQEQRELGCWDVKVQGTSTQSERRTIQFIRPDERAIEVKPGDYILTARTADGVAPIPGKNFTVRIAVGPVLCALVPANVPDPTYPDLKNKPERNDDLFQLGVSIQPGEADLTQFSLMSFNASLSPPYTDLFDFTWELDGKVVPGETGPTFLKPYADLAKTPMGLHTVKLTAKGAREYQDPTESRFNFTPYNGESRTVTCQFRGPA